MSIVLYFGSFNPIHIGHLIIANYVLNETVAEKLWFIISPQNPLKAQKGLMNEYDRLHFIQKAIEGDKRLKVSDIEFHLPRPSYTATTLAYLKEKYPNELFQILMGSDSYQNIDKWYNADYIKSNYKLLIYQRSNNIIQNVDNQNVVVINAPLLDISATEIRGLIRQKKSIRYMVPPEIEKDLQQHPFFK